MKMVVGIHRLICKLENEICRLEVSEIQTRVFYDVMHVFIVIISNDTVLG